MLTLHDPHLRAVLLSHVTAQLSEARPEDVTAAGIGGEQLASLRQLTMVDLNRLAAMRSFAITVAFDGKALQSALRTVAIVREAKALEAYFIRNGASTNLMSRLFKLRRKLTLQRRRELGACRPSGRVPLPDYAVRERIYRVWHDSEETSPRTRYFQLHQTFPDIPIAVLEVVIRDFEADA